MKGRAAGLLLTLASELVRAQQPYRPEIPKTWDPVALATLEVPHADPSRSPVAVPVEYYGRVPVRPVTGLIPYTRLAESRQSTLTGCRSKTHKSLSTPSGSIQQRIGGRRVSLYSMLRSVLILLLL